MRAKAVHHFLLSPLGLTTLLFAFCIPALCDTEVGGPIDEDTTWGPPEDTVYIVVDDVHVLEGVTLTILPGVTARLDPSLSLYADGVLAAVGTEEEGILFTSNAPEPAPGDWRAIRFEGGASSDSSIQHATIEYGGSGGYLAYVEQGGLATCDGGASPQFAHCVFRRSAGVGLGVGLADTSSPARYDISIESCEFADNAGYPVAASPCGVPSVSSCVFTGNTEDAVLVATWDNYRTSCIIGDTTWADPGAPYHVVNYDKWGGGGVYAVYRDGFQDTLTIGPGCVFKFGMVGGAYLCAGMFTCRYWDDPHPPGSIVAEGTADDPIVFTTIEEEPQKGFFIFLGGRGEDEWDIPSEFRHCVFENMSVPGEGEIHYIGVGCYDNRKITFEDCVFRPTLADMGLYVSEGSVDVIGCTFEGCPYSGVVSTAGEGLISGNLFLGGASGVCGGFIFGATVTDNLFMGTSYYPVWFWPGSGVEAPGQKWNPMIFSNTYVDCAKQAIGVGASPWGPSEDAIWMKDTVPYEVFPIYWSNDDTWYYDVTVQNSATLTIEPGVEVRFTGGTGLRVGDPYFDEPELRRGSLVAVGTPEQPIRFTEELDSGMGWKGILLDGTYEGGDNLPSVLQYCVVDHAGTDGSAAIDTLNHNNVSISECTITACSRSGLTVRHGAATVSDCVFALNSGYGISSLLSTVEIDYCDVWGNDLGDYGGGAVPGVGCISDDPEFFDPQEGDYTLTCASPCIDSGDPDAPPVDGTRLDMGAYQFGGLIAAPEIEPYCDGPLFGPGWVWFSIPLDPDECCGQENCYDPNTLLGFECGGNLWYFDRYIKAVQVYQPPFSKWNLAPGDSYLLRLGFTPDQVSYAGMNLPHPFEFKLGRRGWTWVGMPRGMPISGEEFMEGVQVRYPSDESGETRTAREDWSSGEAWVNWGWAFFDTRGQAPKIFSPYAPFGNTDCHPWLGYRVWVRVGDALSDQDPDQVTLVWP